MLAGGVAEVFRQIGTTSEKDLQTAELIALPTAAARKLLPHLPGLIVALAPLAIGAISVAGT